MTTRLIEKKRPETESYTTHLANLLLNQFQPSHNTPSNEESQPLRILDLCTGTGCIPLLLHARLHPRFPHLKIVGVDISPQAISLANRNLRWNVRRQNLDQVAAREQIRFLTGDLFQEGFLERLARHLYAVPSSLVSANDEKEGGADSGTENSEEQEASNVSSTGMNSDVRGTAHVAAEANELQGSKVHGQWDILICNPPYISPRSFARETSRSVRNWEPRLALVPSNCHCHHHSRFTPSEPAPAPAPAGVGVGEGEEENDTRSTTSRSSISAREEEEEEKEGASPSSAPVSVTEGTTRPPAGGGGGGGLLMTTTKKIDDNHGDEFYPRLLSIAKQSGVKITIFEVGSMDQGFRVARVARRMEFWDGIEIWRDWFDCGMIAARARIHSLEFGSGAGSITTMMKAFLEMKDDERERSDESLESEMKSEMGQESVVVKGHGNGRCVVCWKD